MTHKIRTTSQDGNILFINIRLDDECNNGHQDFAITGDIYEAGKPKRDKYHLGSGCIHDEILAVMPELEIFVRLHLSDYNGVPMHAIANMHYHMFEDGMTKERFCEYYRITPEQFVGLIKDGSESKVYYAIKLKELGILDQWKAEATEAIKLLESMTGEKFVNTSTKSNLNYPSDEEIAKFKELQKEGHFSPEKIEERKIDTENKAVKAELEKLIAERDSKVNKANLKCEVYTQILLVGGKKAIDNCIYYDHNDTVKFNWTESRYKLSSDEIDNIIEKAELPEGIEILKEGREL